MKEFYKLYIGNKTFEQSSYNRNTLEKTYDGSTVCNVEDIKNLYITFVDYLMEDGKYIGVILRCDYGQAGNGYQEVTLMPGKEFHFCHWGVCVDDDGCPEDFTIDFYLRLYPWNEI